MVKIEIPDLDIKASIEDGTWACNDDKFLPLLESIIKEPDVFYIPDEDYYFANLAIKEFGGTITHHDEQEFDPDVIY